ncbi:MAG TPA: tetratricopeptide repeat protein, partial [Methanothrix sp.]|nr:tetratricopeptide repeat protein [Methanothrix sp.]
MDQLVVLQEIHSSLSNGRDGLQQIDSSTIKGCCPELMGKLLEGSRNGRIDEAVCRELSEKLQNVYELKRLGDICRRAGLHPLATTTYNRALSICQDPVLRPVLQNNLGQSHASQGDLARAAFYYHKAAEVFQREGDHASLAHVLGNLGSAYRQNMEWDKAIEHCYRSLKTFEEAGDPRGVAQMSASIGRIYADLGERELASRYFEKSLADFRELDDQKSQAWIQDRLGRIAEERTEWDHAINCYQSSISIFEERGEYGNMGVVLSNMGRTFLKMNDPSSAREPLERAVSIISRQAGANYLNALFSLAKTYNSLAEIRLQEAEMQEAETQEEVLQEAKASEAGML